MFSIKIYIKESYINYYDTSIQMCGQYCILAPTIEVLGESSLKNKILFEHFLISSIQTANYHLATAIFRKHFTCIEELRSEISKSNSALLSSS